MFRLITSILSSCKYTRYISHNWLFSISQTNMEQKTVMNGLELEPLNSEEMSKHDQLYIQVEPPKETESLPVVRYGL